MPDLFRFYGLKRGSRMPVILALFFIAAQLALTIHVSSDLLQDHPCPVCQVAQSPAAPSHSQPSVHYSAIVTLLPVFARAPAVITTSFRPSQRAPPTLPIF